jgi:hypothetical protein
VRRHWESLAPSWLRPPAREAFMDDLVRWEAGEPLHWLPSVAREIGDRSHRVGAHNVDRVASEHQVRVFRPFLDPGFVQAFSGETGWSGPPGRTAGMRRVFGDLLPDALLSRNSKAYMTSLAFGDASRSFANSWSGQGLNSDLVDTDALRSCWLAERPHVGTAMALQAAWWADCGGRPTPVALSGSRFP